LARSLAAGRGIHREGPPSLALHEHVVCALVAEIRSGDTQPPSTTISVPVIYEESSLARKSAVDPLVPGSSCRARTLALTLA
jgi:hypothetical protein